MLMCRGVIIAYLCMKKNYCPMKTTTTPIRTLLPLAVLAASGTAAAQVEEKPNIIFVFADQWRKQSLGFRGEDPVQTPNLDKFASWAFSFDNATSCRPVSGPNRACLMTGMYPINNGVFANSVPLDAETPTLGDVCKAAGYATAYIGKWHLGGLNDHVATAEGRHGFDTWVQSMGHMPFNQGYYIGDDPNRVYKKGVWAPTFETDTAIGFIEDNRDKPFCVVLSYNPPHTSGGYMFEDRWQPGKRKPDGTIRYGYGYGGPREYEALYTGVDYRENPIRGNVEPMRKGNTKDRSEGCIPGYFGAITAIDNDFGTLMNYLEQEGLLENTIVVFTADHGESMGSQGLMTKGTWFEESVGVPCIIGMRGSIVNRREQCVFNSIDLLPTLLGMASLPIPPQVDGKDYSPMLTGEAFTPPQYALLSFDFGGVAELKFPRYWRALYSPRYTFVLCGMNSNRDVYTRDGMVLYDRQQDPLQMRPIFKGMGHDGLMDRLFAALAAELDATGDPFIEKYWNNENAGYPELNHYTMDLEDYTRQLESGKVRGPQEVD